MTIRHMDLSPDHPVKGFCIGVITHHFDHDGEGFHVDPYNIDVIKEASTDVAKSLIRYLEAE